MQIQKIIEHLGFSAKEAKVYLTALSLGESHVSDIADKLKLPLSSTQSIVDRMHKAGFMNFYVMSRYKYWVAEKPERLLHRLKQRESLLEEVLPRLSLFKKNNRNKNSKKKNHSLELFKILADTICLPVLIVNSEIEIVYANLAWEKEFGYNIEDVYGKNPSFLKSDKTPGGIYLEMWKALNNEKMFQTDKLVDRRKDGTYFKIMTTFFPVRHESNFFFIQILENINEVLW